MADLTPKQELFCLEYIKDFNATQAAIRAGYSKKTAYSIGSENLSKPEIQEYMQQAIRERVDETKIDAAWLLRRLAAEATADVAEIHDDEGNLRPIKEWPMVWRQGLVAGLEVETVAHSKVSDDDGEPVSETICRLKKVRLSDRIKRLELIGKHVDVGAFADKLVGPDGGPIQIEDKSDLARRLAFLLGSGKT